MSDRDGAAIDTTEDIDALLETVRAITVVGDRASFTSMAVTSCLIGRS
jgi:hypothetical protein